MSEDSPHNSLPAAPDASAHTDRVSKAMAAALARGRDRLNERFAVVRHMHPRLDDAAFVANFLEIGESLLKKMSPATPPEKLDALIFALFEQIALLCGKGFLAGPAGGARVPGFAQRWRQLLAATPDLCLENPRRHLAITGNALLRILQKPEVDADAWLADWIDFAQLHARVSASDANSPQDANDTTKAKQSSTDVALTAGERFELAGFIIAWRAGLAELRRTALGSARRLAQSDAAASRAALVPGTANDDAAKHPTARETIAVIDRLLGNPWRTPADALRDVRRRANPEQERNQNRPAGESAAPSDAPVLRRLGSFLGFGGLFSRPPEVVWSAEGPLCDDRAGLQLLRVDVFGYAFRRVRLQDFEDADFDDSDAESLRSSEAELRLQDGVVIVGGAGDERRYDVPQLKAATSWTSVGGHTLYATTATSHMIYVIGFPFVESPPAHESAPKSAQEAAK